MPQGDDFCNRPQQNFVFQHAADDTGRGVPALGKVVYRTDTDTWEGCVDADPDPLENGGGTWTTFGGWTSWTLWTPTLSATSSAPSLGTGGVADGQYATNGRMVRAQGSFTLGTGGGGGSGQWRTSLPFTSTHNVGSLMGRWFAIEVSGGTINASYEGPVTNFHGGGVSASWGHFQQAGPAPSGVSTRGINSVIPFTWAAGCSLRFMLDYEADF